MLADVASIKLLGGVIKPKKIILWKIQQKKEN
jgi:hypothetical protein